MSSIEVTIIMKDSERTYKHKFLEYNPFSLDVSDHTVRRMIEEAKKNFTGTPEDIVLKTTMVIQ